MAKTNKSCSTEELDKKILELQKLKEKKLKEQQELLNIAKVAYMDNLIEKRKDDPVFRQKINSSINDQINNLNPKKDRKTIRALEELLKQFPVD